MSSVVKQLRLPRECARAIGEKPATFELKDVGVAVHGQSLPLERIMSD